MTMGEGGLDWGVWVEAQARPRLLLVDDEPANLQLLKRVLEADYRLVFARSGEEALARVRAGAPDLILLDVMMPGMSGHEVIRALKADPATAGIGSMSFRVESNTVTGASPARTGWPAGA